MLLHLVAYQVLITFRKFLAYKQKLRQRTFYFRKYNRVTQWVWTCVIKFVVHPDDANNLNFPVSLSPIFYFIVPKWLELEYRGNLNASQQCSPQASNRKENTRSAFKQLWPSNQKRSLQVGLLLRRNNSNYIFHLCHCVSLVSYRSFCSILPDGLWLKEKADNFC